MCIYVRHINSSAIWHWKKGDQLPWVETLPFRLHFSSPTCGWCHLARRGPCSPGTPLGPSPDGILGWGAAPSPSNTTASLLSRAIKPWASWEGQIPAISWALHFFFWFFFFFSLFICLHEGRRLLGNPLQFTDKIFKTEQNLNEQFYKNDLKWQWSANSNHQNAVCEGKLNGKDSVIRQLKHKSKREVISILKHAENSCLGKKRKRSNLSPETKVNESRSRELILVQA